MIKTKKELKEFISYEKKYYGKSRPYLFLPRLSESSIAWRYVCLLRYEEYHFNNHHKIRRIIFHYLSSSEAVYHPPSQTGQLRF